MNYKILFLVGALLPVLGGCASSPYLKGQPQIVAEPDKVSALLADAADRASVSLEKLAAIESRKMQVSASPKLTNVPRELKRGITINWIGPAEDLIEKVAARASYRFKVYGSGPPSPLIVSVDEENRAIVEVLRSVGLQLGSEAALHVNAQEKQVELRYTTKFQDIDSL